MSFQFIVPENMIMFKAIKQSDTYNKDYRNPSWFSTEEGVKTYIQSFNATKIIEVKIQPQIKLINITSTIFHADFMNKVLMYVDNETDRDMLLLALGLPDLEYQKQTLQKICGDSKNPDVLRNFISSRLSLQPNTRTIKLFGDHHRFSISIFDNYFIQFVRSYYPEYQGIVSLKNWPSMFHNEKFPAEACIFDPSHNTMFTQEHIIKRGGSKRIKSGSAIFFDDDRFAQNFEDLVDKEFEKRLITALYNPPNPFIKRS